MARATSSGCGNRRLGFLPRGGCGRDCLSDRKWAHICKICGANKSSAAPGVPCPGLEVSWTRRARRGW